MSNSQYIYVFLLNSIFLAEVLWSDTVPKQNNINPSQSIQVLTLILARKADPYLNDTIIFMGSMQKGIFQPFLYLSLDLYYG